MRLFGTIAFGVALMAGGVARAELINGTQFQSGNWKGAAYTNDNTGRFSHCAMSTAYRSGISMFFAISDNYTWRVGWSSTSWNLNVNQNYPASLTVDGVAAGTVDAKAVNRQFIVGELPAQASLFDLFRRGNLLTVVSGNDRFQFSLAGTHAALTTLISCTRNQVGAAPPSAPQPTQPTVQPQPAPPADAPRPGTVTTPEPANPASQPRQQGPAFGQPPATQPIVQPSAQPTMQPPVNANPNRLWPAITPPQRVEAARTLSAILALPSMQAFRPMSEHEATGTGLAQARRADLAWRSDMLTGTLDVVPSSSGLNPSAIGAAVIAADRRACAGGRFDSGTSADRQSPRVGRVFTTCEVSLRTTEARYMVVPMSDGTAHYVFAMVGPSFHSADGRTEVAKAADELRQAVFEVVRQ